MFTDNNLYGTLNNVRTKYLAFLLYLKVIFLKYKATQSEKLYHSNIAVNGMFHLGPIHTGL